MYTRSKHYPTLSRTNHLRDSRQTGLIKLLTSKLVVIILLALTLFSYTYSANYKKVRISQAICVCCRMDWLLLNLSVLRRACLFIYLLMFKM